MGRFLGESAKGCAPTCPAFESTESAATSSLSIPRVPKSGNDPVHLAWCPPRPVARTSLVGRALLVGSVMPAAADPGLHPPEPGSIA